MHMSTEEKLKMVNEKLRQMYDEAFAAGRSMAVAGPDGKVVHLWSWEDVERFKQKKQAMERSRPDASPCE